MSLNCPHCHKGIRLSFSTEEKNKSYIRRSRSSIIGDHPLKADIECYLNLIMDTKKGDKISPDEIYNSFPKKDNILKNRLLMEMRKAGLPPSIVMCVNNRSARFYIIQPPKTTETRL